MIAGQFEVLNGHLLHLVRSVTRFERGSKRVTLDRHHKDRCGLTGMFDRRLVGCVHLAVVVATALEVPDFFVGHVGDHGLGAWVATKEVVAHEATGLTLVGLVVAVRRCVHEVHERTVAVLCQQGVPFTTPDDLNDVPAGTSEERFELLNDLSVTSHRPVEALQVAVDDEVQVVELFERCVLQHSTAFWFVEFTVTQEGEHTLL